MGDGEAAEAMPVAVATARPTTSGGLPFGADNLLGGVPENTAMAEDKLDRLKSIRSGNLAEAWIICSNVRTFERLNGSGITIMIDFLQSLLGGVLPSWLIYVISFIVNTTVILIVAPVTFMMMTWFERRIVARMQDRLGPNRVGPAGLLQAVADGVKMFTKENITPRAADQVGASDRTGDRNRAGDLFVCGDPVGARAGAGRH